MSEINIQKEKILSAINAELRDTKSFLQFHVNSRQKVGKTWVLSLDIASGFDGLDESLEGAQAWWSEPSKGSAVILAVLPDEEKMVLRYVKGDPPPEGMKIFAYPPIYLEPLLIAWKHPQWSEQALKVDGDILKMEFDPQHTLDLKHFPWLRKSQREVFNAIGYNASFLQGPPGTGKTTTLGALLAEYVLKFPQNKVLLFSTTNLAVDQALVAVDNALESFDKTTTDSIRNGIFRIGNHFIASYYKERRYLLPIKDEELITELDNLLENIPDKHDVEAYEKWQEAIDLVRARIRVQSKKVLTESRLAAMTTTRAIFSFEELKQNCPFDLVVFDESSQVGLVHALMLSTLGKHCLYAGDPKQLSPIAISKQDLTQHWLGKSIFHKILFKSEKLVFLDEQSRMREEICSLVSDIFYDGKLIVAHDKKKDPEWNKEREIEQSSFLGKDSVIIIDIKEASNWSRKYRGPIRYESAEIISEILDEYVESNTIVLTPFKAQRALINTFLRKKKIRTPVRTVHRSQGSQFHTVIFDPVDATNPFMNTEVADQLINVALSRAKVRLIILLHQNDLAHHVFRKVHFNQRKTDANAIDCVDISDIIHEKGFQDTSIDKIVRIKGNVGRIIRYDKNGKDQRMVIQSLSTGEEKSFMVSFLKNNF